MYAGLVRLDLRVKNSTDDDEMTRRVTKCPHVAAGLGPKATGAALQLHKDDVCGFLFQLLFLNK